MARSLVYGTVTHKGRFLYIRGVPAPYMQLLRDRSRPADAPAMAPLPRPDYYCRECGSMFEVGGLCPHDGTALEEM